MIVYILVHICKHWHWCPMQLFTSKTNPTSITKTLQIKWPPYALLIYLRIIFHSCDLMAVLKQFHTLRYIRNRYTYIYNIYISFPPFDIKVKAGYDVMAWNANGYYSLRGCGRGYGLCFLVPHHMMYSISLEICTRFCCALLCCGYAIVHNEFTWSIYPYSSGLLCWHWGNR